MTDPDQILPPDDALAAPEPDEAVTGLAVRVAALEADLVKYRQGVVSTVSPLAIELGASGTPIENVSALASSAFAVDDVVAALAFGNDLLVLGTIGGSGGIPAGAVTAYAANTIPSGWLLCNGQSVSKTTYAGLWNIIGYFYGGSGDNFNVPNLAAKFPLGTGGSHAIGSTGGEETHTLTTTEMPSHNHGGATGATDPAHSHSFGRNVLYTNGGGNTPGGGVNASLDGTISGTNVTSISHTHTVASQGGGGAHNNMPPYLTLNFIIKT